MSKIPENLGLRFGDLSTLPPEVRNQIKSFRPEESQILAAVARLEGTASIDEILVAIWRAEKTMLRRLELARRIYRAVKRGLLFPVPRRRGVYTTRKP